ncbi:pentafunctional polypeptide [Aspergillus luchuensis]|uniref:Pentafunctional polypeptide n=1 Tax=Aspergillus kawachii TaxID=1069201 RepID=A0A146FMS5_ASPKA|nr:pentafunctional polypeptide [Aspergillus luchuensis]
MPAGHLLQVSCVAHRWSGHWDELVQLLQRMLRSRIAKGPGGVMDTFLPAPGMTDQPGDEGDRFHPASRAIRGSTVYKLKSEECVKRYQQCKLRIHVK